MILYYQALVAPSGVKTADPTLISSVTLESIVKQVTHDLEKMPKMTQNPAVIGNSDH